MIPPPPRRPATRRRAARSRRSAEVAVPSQANENPRARVDLDAVRQACEPIGRWWERTQTTGRADPVRLARAVSRTKLLGPLPGPLGAALAYILAGCPDLDYPKVCAAFDRVAAASRFSGPTPDDLGQSCGPAGPVQLRFEDIVHAAGEPAREDRPR